MFLIPLTQERFALVDDEDADLLAGNWQAIAKGKTWYARRHVAGSGQFGRKEYLHRVIAGRMSITGEIDHCNRSGLDNRRGNLRAATRSQQICNTSRRVDNTSGFKGVSFFRQSGRWQAYVNSGGKRRHLGYFSTADEAAKAHDVVALELHGTFAVLNFRVEE